MILLTLTTGESVSQYTGNELDECVELCEKTEIRHENHGSMSKKIGSRQYLVRQYSDAAEGTDERVLALNTDVCKRREMPTTRCESSRSDATSQAGASDLST